MELVYLWVEEYKNIKNQGFNFSPRFECKFDGEKLTVNENKDYVSIFPKNINVTAIVGENGSGKSTIIDFILKCYEDEYDKDYIIVLKNNDDSLMYQSNKNLKADIRKISFSTFRNVFVYNRNSHNHPAFRKYTTIEIDKVAIANILSVEYGKEDQKFNILPFMYLPNRIEIKLREDEELINENINFFKPQERDEIRTTFLAIKDDYHKFLFISYGRNSQLGYSKEILNSKEALIQEIEPKLSEVDYHNFFQLVFNSKVFEISKLTEKQKEIYIRENGFHHFFNFDFLDEKERRFNDLSHGEQTIFAQLLNIYFLSNSKIDKFIFLLDEPDLSLHPNWQKQYLNEIIKLCKKLEKKYHFIITSHSPFILSDLPTKNIIFLKNGKQEYPFKENEQTFGANIHTLLSHGFFMEDGLMGEFAKSKISDVIELLKKEQLSEDEIKDCKHIISIIGEPILQKTLEHQLNEKLNPNETELQKLEREQKEIQEKIDKLKRENNETN